MYIPNNQPSSMGDTKDTLYTMLTVLSAITSFMHAKKENLVISLLVKKLFRGFITLHFHYYGTKTFLHELSSKKQHLEKQEPVKCSHLTHLCTFFT